MKISKGKEKVYASENLHGDTKYRKIYFVKNELVNVRKQIRYFSFVHVFFTSVKNFCNATVRKLVARSNTLKLSRIILCP